MVRLDQQGEAVGEDLPADAVGTATVSGERSAVSGYLMRSSRSTIPET